MADPQNPESDPQIQKLYKTHKHGFYMGKLPESYEAAYLEAIQDPNMTSLNPEIAVMRTLISKHLEHAGKKMCPMCGAGVPPDLTIMARAVEGVGRNIERQLGKRKVLTPKGVMMVVEAIAQAAFREFGEKDPQGVMRFIESLKQLKPSEDSLQNQGDTRTV